VSGRRFHENFPTTAFLLLFILAFFGLELTEFYRRHGGIPGVFDGFGGDTVHLLGALRYHDVYERHEYWRMVSATFLHGGLLHILFSVWILYDVGRFCEPLLSSWKLLTVYLLAGIGGSIASLAWKFKTDFDPPSVGASGALSGIIGLMLVYSWRQNHRQLRDQMVSWVFTILIFSLVAGRIDHAGHAGGFVVGCAFGYRVKDYMTSETAARWRWPGYAAAVVLAYSLGSALWNYFSLRGQL
jgi:membrane associated rhomboid family serine protease